jgi:hypothetical protein
MTWITVEMARSNATTGRACLFYEGLRSLKLTPSSAAEEMVPRSPQNWLSEGLADPQQAFRLSSKSSPRNRCFK